MRDRAQQALYLLGLDPIVETQADYNSYGFRLQRSCADALVQCHRLLCKRHSPQWILEGDIKACFDRIGRDWLLKHIPIDSGFQVGMVHPVNFGVLAETTMSLEEQEAFCHVSYPTMSRLRAITTIPAYSMRLSTRAEFFDPKAMQLQTACSISTSRPGWGT